ncbi:MAG TPA: malate dehydrogenase [Bacteroidales bacterium]|nr:malate dehydrogenase [Bacteroidales bacterium]HPT53117.1 malate dehydrogenase [Bacteroidales bacterium]
MSKVSIIGAGAVGSSCAYCLAEKGIVNHITLLDIVPGVAEGKALDMCQAAAIQRFDTTITGVTQDYSATNHSDIVVITSGMSRKPGMHRNDLIISNVKIIREVVKKVVWGSPHAIIIVVSNPLDVLCYCAYMESQFPAHRVMGMSGLLDIARYKSFIAAALNVSTKDIQALIMGGHGNTMVPLPRYTTIGGIPIRKLMQKEQIDEIIDRTRMGGDELIQLLGTSAWYAAGASICQMIEAIVCDQRRVFPVCAFLNGEYGIQDIYLGVPVILGKNGIEKVIELELDEEDKEQFLLSEEVVRENVNIIREYLNRGNRDE